MRPERPSPLRPSLASIQTAAMALITGRDAGGPVPEASSLFVSDARGSAQERIAVYAYMYRARLAEALESQFPRLAKRLGPEAFSELASAYVTDEPSRHPSLRHLGQRLPDWLAARRPDAPAIVGLARLEWARADVFDLVDQATLTLEGVRAWPPDRLGELPLRLLEAHRLVAVAPGTAKQWDALGGVAGRASGQTVRGGDSERLVVWREGTSVYHRVVDDDEHAALELASLGVTFGEICESLLVSHGEEAAIARAYAWMSTWLADGLLAAPAP